MNKVIFYIICIITSISSANAQTISLLFAGDAMQHQAQLDDAKRGDDFFFYNNNFDIIKDEISSADIAVVNFETTLGEAPYSGYPAFCSPDEFAVALQKCGFDIFLTANNHCLDRGSKGIFRTIDVLDSLKIKHLGTYKSKQERETQFPMIVRKGDIKIGMLNYTYGTNGIIAKQGAIIDYIDTTLIKRDIAFCNIKGADIIIANIHWGDEYQLTPNIHQKRLSDWLHKNGIRVVIGSHPHVIQPIEAKTDSCGNIEYLTVYSLGNFISNMRTQMTKGAIIFRMNLVKENDSIRIANPKYAKIFTQRPDIVKGEPYKILPCDSFYIKNNIKSIKLKSDMLIFSEETDKLFKKHNKGKIYEYFFYKISPDSCINKK